MTNHEGRHQEGEGSHSHQERELKNDFAPSGDSPVSDELNQRGQSTAGLDGSAVFNLRSPLSAQEEQLMANVIGCAIAVHRELGPGFLESIYQKAMCIELTAQRIAFEAERPIHVVYRGVDIPGQRVDLIVEDRLVVELKSVVQFDRVHVAQVISYLKTTGLRGGLLINFRAPLLRSGLKRIVL